MPRRPCQGGSWTTFSCIGYSGALSLLQTVAHGTQMRCRRGSISALGIRADTRCAPSYCPLVPWPLLVQQRRPSRYSRLHALHGSVSSPRPTIPGGSRPSPTWPLHASPYHATPFCHSRKYIPALPHQAYATRYPTAPSPASPYHTASRPAVPNDASPRLGCYS